MEAIILKALLQKLWDFFNRHINVFKVLFVLFVLGIVIHVGISEGSEISGKEMAKSFATQTPLSLISMTILGFIAVTPMLIYDFTIVDFFTW